MSEFGKPRGCNNGCNAMIYFDAHSTVGHPSSEKWIPLEFKNGLKTDLAHDCPKKKQQNGLIAAATSTASTDNLAMIKVIAAALNEYIAIKETHK